ncbi:MAG: hypothetical protein M3P96_16315 [Actinomycetota bacterium]|nr:hypothetical protein [Actinomycetota bacterium]
MLSRRGAADEHPLSARVVGEQSRGRYLLEVVVGERDLPGSLPARWDLWLRRQVPAEDGGPPLVRQRRLKGPEALRSAAPVLTVGDGRMQPYLTASGALGFRVAALVGERRGVAPRELLDAGAVWAAMGRALHAGDARELARRVRRRIGV